MINRRALGIALTYAGISSGWRHLNRRHLSVIAYHRVGQGSPQSPTLFDDFVYSCSTEVFEKQLDTLGTIRRFVTLDDVVDAFAGRLRLPPYATLLTFDDATIDHFRIVFPILRRRGIQGVFFVPTRSIQQRHVGWWNLLSYALKHCSRGTYRLPNELGGGELHIDTHAKRTQAFLEISRVIKKRGFHGDATASVDRLLERLAVPAPSTPAQSAELMTFDQLAIMRRAGMAIGSHTHSHPFLSRLDMQEQLREMQVSKRILTDATGAEVLSVSYPYGGKSDYDNRSIQAAMESGYECAFNMDETLLVTPAAAARYDIGRFTPPVTADGHFVAALSGLRI